MLLNDVVFLKNMKSCQYFFSIYPEEGKIIIVIIILIFFKLALFFIDIIQWDRDKFYHSNIITELFESVIVTFSLRVHTASISIQWPKISKVSISFLNHVHCIFFEMCLIGCNVPDYKWHSHSSSQRSLFLLC
jgi:hypothetical protein